MNLYEVIRRPVLTEKNSQLMTQGKYVFQIAMDANKPLVKQAVEAIFGVTVTAVNIIKLPAKARGTKRSSRRAGFSSPIKKAVVTLAPGQRIQEFEEV